MDGSAYLESAQSAQDVMAAWLAGVAALRPVCAQIAALAVQACYPAPTPERDTTEVRAILARLCINQFDEALSAMQAWTDDVLRTQADMVRDTLTTQSTALEQ